MASGESVAIAEQVIAKVGSKSDEPDDDYITRDELKEFVALALAEYHEHVSGGDPESE